MTLIDALGPISVPHDPVQDTLGLMSVPILAKHVDGKIFDEAFSTVHISGKEHIILIIPLRIDLLLYKEKLDQVIFY